MSWVIPPTIPKYRYTRTRYIDREFGIEYTKFENQQIRDFDLARKNTSVEITGYVSWIDRSRFLLRPARTAAPIYFICKITEGVDYPPNNQYVWCKGEWGYEINPEQSTTYKILKVTDIQNTSPDFGIVKPDINIREFTGIMFENWRNVDDNTQSLISQSLVSSPTSTTRAGGFTLSHFNLAKELLVNRFTQDLRRLIPREILKNEPPLVAIREIGLKQKLPSFGWSHLDLDELKRTSPQEYANRLNRVPLTDDEYSISFLSEKGAPVISNSEELAKTDYPIIFEEHVERKTRSYYTSPEIYKFLLASHLIAPAIDLGTYQKGIEYSRNELLKVAKTDEILSKLTGNNGLLDVGINGRPTSILNLTLSYERSDFDNKIDFDDVKRVTATYLDNIDHVSRIWQDLKSDIVSPLATLNTDERRLIAFLIDHGPSTEKECIDHLKITDIEFAKLINLLIIKNAVYQPQQGKYASALY